MKGSKFLKALTVTIIVLMVLVGAAGTYYFYYQAKNERQAKINCQEELSLIKSEASQTNSSQSDDCVPLSEQEEQVLEDWTTYTDEESRYSFQYPADWSLEEEDSVITVSGQDSSKEVSFQVRLDQASEIGFGQNTVLYTQETEVDCQPADQVNYQGEDDLRLITYSLTESDLDYLLIFSYYNLGASYSADMIDTADLIIKTFKIN